MWGIFMFTLFTIWDIILCKGGLQMRLKLLVITAIAIATLCGCSEKSPAKDTASKNNLKPTSTAANLKPTPKPTPVLTPVPAKIDNPDFRNIKWGMSMSEVEEADGEPSIANSEGLVYEGLEVAGIEVTLLYYFNEDDQLYRALYTSDESHINKNDFIYDYEKIVDALTEKYGEPYDSNIIWKDDLYQDDPMDWGMAVSAGHMMKFAKWDTENTSIMIFLTGDNFEITTMIGYESKTISPPKEDITEGL